jgi:predicted dehydrogenase
VLCEKPLSGVSADAELIEKRAKELGKWVMIGYQWSYSAAILALKEDVLNGTLGKPVFLKTITLWPRKKEYFARGTGWAGKLKASDGTVINDSVAANATAHYLHNILFVCGERYLAAEAKNIKADLIRVNNIENFDNTTISFELEGGAKCLFIAAHSTAVNRNPVFEYRFENATVTYNENDKKIIAKFNDGSVKDYGSPESAGSVDKAYQAIAGCLDKNFKPVCSPYTAAAHTRVIEEIQKNKISTVKPEYIKENGTLVYIDGLDSLLQRCYNEEIMLRDTADFSNMVKNDD